MQQLQSQKTALPVVKTEESVPNKSEHICFKLISVLFVILILFALTVLGASLFESYYPLLLGASAALLASAAWVVLQLRKEISTKLVQPLNKIIVWSGHMARGELKTRIPIDENDGYPDLIDVINELSDRVHRLTNEMQQEVRKQTERIKQKNHTLEVLYDVAASINISKNLEDLLLRFLPSLKEVLKAEAITVRLVTSDGQMRLIGGLGIEPWSDRIETLIPVLHCMYGSDIDEGELLSKDRILNCEIYPGQPFYGRDDIEMVAVPLQHRGKNLGVYNLFLRKPGLIEREDAKELLVSIGRHLGVAIEKAHTDSESKRLSIYRERSMLSHELHDSLAQTLAACKFQVRTLKDSVKQGDNEAANREIEQLTNGLDEAYTELRELIAHFRAPFDERGLISAIENVVRQFRDSTEISLYFQNNWPEINLSSLHEIQILRIIQESLTNIKKHSQARSVRLVLSHDEDRYTVLIEDDGVGIGEPVLGGHAGEQVGLAIMKERALRIGGQLEIDSEPGEGTLLKLTFQHPAEGLLEHGNDEQ